MTNDPDDDEIFEPVDSDIDNDAEQSMEQGRVDLDGGNNLRDPWFDTDEGRAWLAERGES